MAQVTKDTMIGDLLRIDAGVAPILMSIGMHCLGCPSSQGETIAEAAMVHGIDPEALVAEFRSKLKLAGIEDVLVELQHQVNFFNASR